jgi:hypothetical protein
MVKKLLILILLFILSCIVILMISNASIRRTLNNPDIHNRYKRINPACQECIPLEFFDLPAVLISRHTPIKVVWQTGGEGVKTCDMTHFGLKISETVIYEGIKICYPSTNE